MDRNREEDARTLSNKMYDRSIPYFFRSVAGRSYLKIQQQLKDKKLSHLRYQLIRAHGLGDQKAIDSIGETIRHYSYKKYGAN